MNLALGIILLILALFLVLAVVSQSGKSHGLSGSIAGTAETFFGKDKGTRIDRILGKLTAICGAVFVVAVLLVYFLQPEYTSSNSLVGDAWSKFSMYFGY